MFLRIWLLLCNSLTLEKMPPLRPMLGTEVAKGGTSQNNKVDQGANMEGKTSRKHYLFRPCKS